MIDSDGLSLRKPAMKVKNSLLVRPQYHLTRVHSPDGVELFFACRPDPRAGQDLASQLQSLYGTIFQCLSSEGASAGQVVMEKIFFRDSAAGSEALRALRSRTSRNLRWEHYSPASILVQEPPHAGGELCGAEIQVIIPAGNRSVDWRSFSSPYQPQNGGRSPDPATGKVLLEDGKVHLWIGNILGNPGGDFYSEALSMFERADSLLASQGIPFQEVVRTWIYLREMERDYGELNRARRTFFRNKGVERRPASTGIGGAPTDPANQVCMALYAVIGLGPDAIDIMRTATLNEAHEYGSDFSRGMKVETGSLKTLYISGTASVDEAGLTLAVGDFDAQVDRMLLNIETLLENDGATFGDIVTAITYLKNIEDTERFKSLLAKRGMPDFPHSIVHAEVCRPELLCEMEAIAVVPSEEK